MSPAQTAAHDARTGAGRWWTWLLVSAAVIAADQFTKSLVESALRVGEQRALTANFSIVLAYNSGAAFSFLADASGWQRYLFTAFAVAASVLMVWLLRRGGDRVYSLALSLILGGALGNLWDRLTLGKVVDFLLVHDYLPFGGGFAARFDPFPAFNVADSALTVGVALLILDSFRPHHADRAAMTPNR
ncbi:MAG TPA: signal peptidase II [Casimicrobiaceae bacterium]|jgi:signal peptidase II|nr:signal peptidase II [Casimicrobiaceae bacterium]